jgi:hypothetical protein
VELLRLTAEADLSHVAIVCAAMLNELGKVIFVDGPAIDRKAACVPVWTE